MTPYFEWDDVAEFIVTVTVKRGPYAVGYRIKGEDNALLIMPLGWGQHPYRHNATALARLWHGWQKPQVVSEKCRADTAEFIFAQGADR